MNARPYSACRVGGTPYGISWEQTGNHRSDRLSRKRRFFRKARRLARAPRSGPEGGGARDLAGRIPSPGSGQAFEAIRAQTARRDEVASRRNAACARGTTRSQSRSGGFSRGGSSVLTRWTVSRRRFCPASRSCSNRRGPSQRRISPTNRRAAPGRRIWRAGCAVRRRWSNWRRRTRRRTNLSSRCAAC